MRRFEYFEPSSLPEAIALLARYQGRAQPLAGGTDLLVELKEQLRRADCVINIKKIPGIDRLSFDAYDGLHIGALVTAREIEVSPVVLESIVPCTVGTGTRLDPVRNRAPSSAMSAAPRRRRTRCRVDAAVQITIHGASVTAPAGRISSSGREDGAPAR